MKITLRHFVYGILSMLAVQVHASNFASAQSRELDSLKRVLLRTKSDTARIGLLYAIGIKSNVSRLSYWDSLLEEAHLHHSLLYELRILDKMGTIYFAEDNVSKTIEQCTKGLALAEQLGDKGEMSRIILYLIRIYNSLLDRKNTLLYIYKGLKIAEQLKDYKTILDLYSELALYYMSSGELNRALKIHFKCLHECKKIEYNYGIVSSLVDIGSDYCKLNNWQKAGYYYLESLKYADKLKESPFVLYHIYNSVSAAYGFMQRYDSAYYYALKGYDMAKLMKDKRAIASMMVNLGGIREGLGDYKEAEKLTLQSLAICKSTNFTAELPIIYGLLERIYTKTGNFKKALNAYKLSVQIRDSLSNEQVRKQAMEKEFAYTYEKKEQAYNILAQKNQIQTLQLKQDRFMMAGFIALLLATIAIAYLYFKQNKFRIEHTKILMEQKLLLSQMNPHFIFNSLNSIQQFIMKGQNTHAEVYLSKFSKLIRELLENSTRENLTVQEEIEMLQVYLEMESLRFSGSFKYDILVDNTIDITHAAIPHLMVQPFVENAIWHGLLPKPNDRYLQIKFAYHTNQSIQCTVYDNGVGRTASAQKQPLLNKKSLAMNLIKKRIGVMNQSNPIKSNITVVDRKDSAGNSLGTTIVLVLPILNV